MISDRGKQMTTKEITVKLRRLSDDAVVPTKATKGSSGYDLYITEDEMVLQGHTQLCKTGIAIELPMGYEGQVRSRSGLAKHGIVVANSPGTIDSDYRGEVGVLLYNQGDYDRIMYKGERIAQLVIQKIPNVTIEEVDNFSDTDRGSGGFGSSGS